MTNSLVFTKNAEGWSCSGFVFSKCPKLLVTEKSYGSTFLERIFIDIDKNI